MPLSPVTLRGATIELVPLSFAHVDALCVHGLDPQLWRSTTIQLQTRDDAAAYVESALAAQQAGTALPFAIVEMSSGRVIGSTRFHSYVPEHRRIEIGFTWIGVPWQRTGVNAQSKFLLLGHAFESLGCVRVQFHADTGNAPSRAAIERLGAKCEGVLRSYRVTGARGVRDLAIYSILAAEWPEVRAQLEQRVRFVRSSSDSV